MKHLIITLALCTPLSLGALADEGTIAPSNVTRDRDLNILEDSFTSQELAEEEEIIKREIKEAPPSHDSESLPQLNSSAPAKDGTASSAYSPGEKMIPYKYAPVEHWG